MDRATDARAQGGDDAASACRAVVVGLRLSPGWTAAAAYLEQGGRLRLQAVAGTQRVLDGLAPSAGVAGRALRTAREVVEQHPAVPVLDGTGTEVALPVRCHGDLAGVLVVAGPAPVAPADLREARRAAVRLGEVLTALGPGGGAPRDAAARRLLRHAAALAGVEDAERIGPAVLRAALDVAPLRSALLATSTRDGGLEPRWSAGPLGEGLTEAADPGDARRAARRRRPRGLGRADPRPARERRPGPARAAARRGRPHPRRRRAAPRRRADRPARPGRRRRPGARGRRRRAARAARARTPRRRCRRPPPPRPCVTAPRPTRSPGWATTRPSTPRWPGRTGAR